MSKLSGLLLIISALTLLSCNKKLSGIFYRNRNVDQLVVNDFDFEYMTAKSKIDFSDENTSFSFSGTANMRLRKDSIVWISLSPGLGIEAARVLITRDSVFLINKIEKEYTLMSFEDLSKKFNFDINYELVESVILGNLIYPYTREQVNKSAEQFTYKQEEGKFSFENFVGARTMKLEKVEVQDTLSENTISVNYSDFQLVEEEILPFKIAASLSYKDKSKGTTKVEMEYKQTNIDEKSLKFPFNIPQKYERK